MKIIHSSDELEFEWTRFSSTISPQARGTSFLINICQSPPRSQGASSRDFMQYHAIPKSEFLRNFEKYHVETPIKFSIKAVSSNFSTNTIYIVKQEEVSNYPTIRVVLILPSFPIFAHPRKSCVFQCKNPVAKISFIKIVSRSGAQGG